MKSCFRSVSVTNRFCTKVIVSVMVLETVSGNEGMLGNFGFEVGRTLGLEADGLESWEWGATK